MLKKKQSWMLQKHWWDPDFCFTFLWYLNKATSNPKYLTFHGLIYQSILKFELLTKRQIRHHNENLMFTGSNRIYLLQIIRWKKNTSFSGFFFFLVFLVVVLQILQILFLVISQKNLKCKYHYQKRASIS